jgi:long-subunit acyl-CoA synthetase (AMP-forming)
MNGKKIAIVSENNADWAFAYYAIIVGGNVCVPMDAKITYDDIADQLIRCDCDAVVYSKSYTAKELATAFAGLSDQLDENTVSLMYLYYNAVKQSNPEWKLTIEELFSHLYENMLNDERFSVMIDDAMRQQILGAKGQIEDGVSQMVGENYSLMMIETTLPLEGEETTQFMEMM